MGFCLISSASAMDIDDSDQLSDSNDLSSASISSASDVDSVATDDSYVNLEKSGNIDQSDENSENEVLSTNNSVEDSDLDYDSNDKNSKGVLSASANGSDSLQATTKTKTSLVAKSNSVYRGNSFQVTLKNSAGKALANQKVNIKVLGVNYARTTNSNGVASLPINLANGKYSVVCSFAETSAYQASSLSLTLTVSPKPTSFKASSFNIMRGNSFSVSLKDGNGNALANKKVQIRIPGKTYTFTTSASGIASLQINLYPNRYAISCSFGGDNDYAASSLSGNLTVAKNPNIFSLAEIEKAAANVKTYVNNNKKLPNTVTVGSRSLKISEFSYLASKAIQNINGNNRNDITLLSGLSNCGLSAHSLKSTVYKAQYMDVNKRVLAYMESNKVPAGYAYVKNTANKVIGNADFNLYTFAFAKILAFDRTDKYLPNYCAFESSDLANAIPKTATSLKLDSATIIRGDSYKVTLVDSSGNKLANQKVTITIPGKSYSITTNSNGIASLALNLIGGMYSISSSFAGSNTYKEAKITNTITVKNSSSRFYISDIEVAAKNLKNYVNKNAKLPSAVTVANTKISVYQFSYLMSKAICNINAGMSLYAYIALPSGISKNNSTGTFISSNIYKAQYVDMSKRVVAYIEANKVPLGYATVCSSSGSTVGRAEFDLYTYATAKILDFHRTDKYLPNYCLFDSSVIGSSDIPIPGGNGSSRINANSSQFKNGLNEKNTESSLAKYLVGTGQSAITASITNLANRLTKGLSGTDQKALAIYNYVRDNIAYSYYADSRYGAAGTLSNGAGNCVDQASLVVALCRAAGIHARYSHAQGCTFSSGLVTGHVWAQILINGVWYSADATSKRNNLGNIHNWNTNSYYSLKKYAAVPF